MIVVVFWRALGCLGAVLGLVVLLAEIILRNRSQGLEAKLLLKSEHTQSTKKVPKGCPQRENGAAHKGTIAIVSDRLT